MTNLTTKSTSGSLVVKINVREGRQILGSGYTNKLS